MKRLLLIVSAILSLVTLQAQTPVTDGYLTSGDIVTIAYDFWGAGYRYLEASADGIRTAKVASDKCFWEIGITENNSAYFYTFKSLATNRYLGVKDNGNQNYSMILSDAPTSYRQSESEDNDNNAERAYLYGRFYYTAANNMPVYLNWEGDNYHLATWWGHPNYIEKWNKEGADTPGGGFYPETLIFPYASNDSEAQAQEKDVTFTIPETAVVSYQCVNRPDEIIGGGQNNVDEGDITDFCLYWESSNTTTSEIKPSNYYTPNPSDGYVLPEEGTDVLTLTEGASAGTNKTHTFIITPVGKSPMNLRTNTNNRIQWVNYADRVVAEYKYKGNTVKQTMRVVRNSYHEEQLPPLTFHVNPTMFTFGADAETVNITVVPIHQHGRVIYDVNQNVFMTEYEEHDPAYPEQLTLNSEEDGWEINTKITTDDGADWLSYKVNTNSIAITAQALGDGQSDRTATFKGTFHREQAGGGHEHEESFTIQLAQRSDAGIQFVKKDQEVHTATRTIYYLPEDKIELRLAESNFFGYMRWYDYHTGKAPNYNFGNNDPTYVNYNYATSWYTTPRGANNQPFTPINTPASAATEGDEGRSWGLYAINHHHGGILNEGTENSNNIPVLNGWNYKYTKGQTYSTEQAKRAAGYHTIACDVSAYTDYEITTEGGVVKSIEEPTLSYRQLFDLRPAGEMADTLAARSERGEYLEEYHYQAPAGKNILLTPQFKYRKGTNDEYLSKLCYFYWNGNDLVRVEDAKWSGGNIISDNGEYLTVSGNAGETKTYTLTANDGAVLIAKFTVTFTNPQETGPSRTVLKSDYEIVNIYSRKAHIDFNYTDDRKKTTLSDGFTYYNQPLNAAESTYGFVYTQGDLAKIASNNHHGFVRAANQGVFPFYGEYVLVNGVNKSWNEAGISAENHGGKDKGFALYVDGTTEPGLVVSISAPANICSGQTMYCSAWLCNPSNAAHQGSNPIFRFNVQGRKTGQTEWEDAGVYFVGELLQNSGWQQVVFPINSAHSYDETRVSIYNFATTNNGNDFMVDDISLFVSRLPIAAYQGKMACRSTDTETTSAAAVLRLDYSNINAGADGYMYYQIYNESYDEDGDDKADGAPVNLTGDAAYYHEAHQGGEHIGEDSYGSVHIPAASFDPKKEYTSLQAEGIDTLGSVSKLLDLMVERGQKHAKAYVRTVNNGVTKWLLYVAHIIENVTDNDMSAGEYAGYTDEQKKQLPLQFLYDKHNYSMRMAYSPEELATPACNMTTPLHATQQTVFTLRNSDNQLINHTNTDGILTANGIATGANGEIVNIFNNSYGNCANDLYFLTTKVINHLAIDGAGGEIVPVEAPIFADWLIGDPAGDVLSEKAPVRSDYDNDDAYNTALADYNTRLQASIAGFKEMYGYTHGQVSTAIMYDMRRFTTNDPKSAEYNPNYYAKTFEELQPSKFLSQQNYDIIKHLYDNDWLQLYDTTVHFYLGSNETVRYWCFPIAETAKATVEDAHENEIEVTVKDCNEPRRIMVSSVESDYFLNITPLPNDQKTPQQKVQLPTVKVVADANNTITQVSIPIKELTLKDGKNVKIGGTSYNIDEILNFSISSLPDYITFFDLATGKAMQEAPTLEVGKEYTMRLSFQDENGYDKLGNVDNACRVGYVLFTIQIVPNTMVWQPKPTGQLFNGWGLDANWKGWINDVNNNGIPDQGDTFTEGYVPMEGVDVVIPSLGNPLLYPYIVPEHEHDHYPMAVHHDQHKCRNIYFAAGAHINNQHLLEYEKAFVDMQITSGKWNMVSAPLQGMVSGDMFVPHDGWYNNGNLIAEPNPFEVLSFRGIRHADAAYAFWQQFYNKTVHNHYEDGGSISTASIEFVQTNSLSEPLAPAHGYNLYGLGLETDETLTIRLPKLDSEYHYFTSTGEQSGVTTQVDRQASGKFAFEAGHDDPEMEIKLTNNEASDKFLFGNPTMAYIDMQAFLADNSEVLNPVFHRIQNSVWLASTELIMAEDRYLAPMTSVLLETKDQNPSTTLDITLSASHLTLNNQIYTVEEIADSPNQIQARERIFTESERLTIYALTPKASARTILATNPIANDYYLQGEDALFVSSGIENNTSVKSPLNMYTVAEQVPMMADVRQGVSQVPLAFLVDSKTRTDYMQLAFYLSPNWSRECDFYDSQTGQKIRIMDGLVITVEMPQNHEQRYYIEGPDEYLGSSEDPQGPTTAVDNTSSSALATLQAFSLAQGELTIGSNQLIQEIRLYDLAGRLILDNSLTLLHTTTTVTAPSGICLVEAVLRDGTTLHTQALVK